VQRGRRERKRDDKENGRGWEKRKGEEEGEREVKDERRRG